MAWSVHDESVEDELLIIIQFLSLAASFTPVGPIANGGNSIVGHGDFLSNHFFQLD